MQYIVHIFLKYLFFLSKRISINYSHAEFVVGVFS